MARVIGFYKSGAHIQNGRVAPEVADIITYKRVRQVELETLDGQPIVVTQDGECAPRNTLTAKVKPSAARVVLPKAGLNAGRNRAAGAAVPALFFAENRREKPFSAVHKTFLFFPLIFENK